jgi:hypothetical protein
VVNGQSRLRERADQPFLDDDVREIRCGDMAGGPFGAGQEFDRVIDAICSW